MLRVKLCSNTGDIALQGPPDLRCHGVEFVLGLDAREYDWLVVYSDFPASGGRFSTHCEELACHPDNTLFITHEPSPVKRYNGRMTGQFHWVISSQEPWALRHPRLLRTHPASPWGFRLPGEGHRSARSPEKALPISTFCRLKDMRYTLHQDRLRFVRRLAGAMEELDVFGPLGRPLREKGPGLLPYRCHLTIENHIAEHYWTEKLADAFLGFTLPLYCGCPNVSDYFPEESLIPVDIFDFDGAVETIRRAIADGEHGRRLPHILEARRRVLDEHNLLAVVARFVTERHTATPRPTPAPRIRNHRGMLWRNPLMGVGHAIAKAAVKRRHLREYEGRRRASGLYA